MLLSGTYLFDLVMRGGSIHQTYVQTVPAMLVG